MRKYELEGTATALNLAKAFAGESIARNRYTFYAELAKKEGMPVIEGVFLETADNERGHAEAFYEFLTDGLPETILQPQILVAVTMAALPDNLYAAAKGEYEEWSSIYPTFAKKAVTEGFDTIAKSFYSVAEVEKRHDFRFRDLLQGYQTGTLFTSPREAVWQCSNCGYRHTGTAAPDICPACRHDKEYFYMPQEL